MAINLEDFGIKLFQPLLVENLYLSQRSIFIHNISKPNMEGLFLDLNALPTKPEGLKEAVIKWLISVNLNRIQNEEPPIITLEVVLKCPIWKIVKPPITKIGLTKEKLFNKPLANSMTKSRSVGSINKRKK